jgi:hypothetical protein
VPSAHAADRASPGVTAGSADTTSARAEVVRCVAIIRKRVHRKADVDAVDGFDSAAAFAATVEVTPPDYDDIPRTLTVSISGDPGRTLSVTAERGPAPQLSCASSINTSWTTGHRRTGKTKPTGAAFRTATAAPPRDRLVHDVRTHCATTSTNRS